jgi:ABC-type sulfate/molybdate transport systems ATPase subunit
MRFSQRTSGTDRLDVTTVLVKHEQAEALSLVDVMAVMGRGPG